MTEPAASSPLRTLAVGGACTAWIALALQFVLLVQKEAAGGRSAWHALVVYLGFFTILTNTLCALIFTAFALRRLGQASATLALLRRPWLVTSAATCILMVGSVYVLVLRRLWNPTGLQLWVDVALHEALPLLFLAFWWAAVQRGALRWRDVARILVYPLAYLVYVLVRGVLTGSYPYFFVDVTAIGLPATLRNALGLLVIGTALAALLILINRRRSGALLGPPGPG